MSIKHVINFGTYVCIINGHRMNHYVLTINILIGNRDAKLVYSMGTG